MKDVDSRLLIKVPLRVMATSILYATGLALVERKLHLKPDYEWMEVAVGVGLTIVPVALEAHAIEEDYKQQSYVVDWKTYEGAVWRSFLAAGAPIIFWQIGETIVRKLELMSYLSGTDKVRCQTDVPPHVSQTGNQEKVLSNGHNKSVERLSSVLV